VVVLAAERDQYAELAFVAFGASLDPRAGHQLHAVELRNMRNLRVLGRRIGAQSLGVMREQADVAVQFRLARKDLLGRILIALEWIDREAADLALPVRDMHRAIEECPQADVQRRDDKGQQKCAPQRFADRNGNWKGRQTESRITAEGAPAQNTRQHSRTPSGVSILLISRSSAREQVVSERPAQATNDKSK